ncbi:hypothetical protein GRI97_00815 [Altererythrobacter xixiisoli]|uniref:PAS domain-containing protein n=1 Tax=Croceibacterium xixiisoli TaxID=1476466 RepID=A0A6I4TSF1_9SPHN|nr:hypothetical protein [Croceibacterium xixiisoli]MXO97528.1 hypothetical protein [Croceibacterium xixiisoli]
MDRLRGSFDPFGGDRDGDPDEEDFGVEAAPIDIGQSERRMQVRAYNHWASLLQHRNYPAPSDLDPSIPEFGPFSILLDFTAGRADPAIAYLGQSLAEECGVAGERPRTLNDLPTSSLLNQISDHWAQTIDNEAPVGFAAEFINQRNATILYRGILLPFSADDRTVDFIYGVINWKEQVDARTASDLQHEIGRMLADRGDHKSGFALPMTDWADGPCLIEGFGLVDTIIHDGADEADRSDAGEGLPARLRAMTGCLLEDLRQDGPEFSLALIRRDGPGQITILGEIPEDPALLGHAAQRLLG